MTANGPVYALFFGAAFVKQPSCHICQVFVRKRRDNHKWRIHHVSCRNYFDNDLKRFILLQPSLDPFVFGMVFGFHIPDDLPELRLLSEAVEHGVIIDTWDHP